jgi:hypothetical protein
VFQPECSYTNDGRKKENSEISDSQFIQIETGFKLLGVSSFDRLTSFPST